MKINHIINSELNNYSVETEFLRKRYEGKDFYEVVITHDINFGRNYFLRQYKRNRHIGILSTGSKEEMKVTLDLLGLRFEQVNIFMLEKSTGKTNVTYSLIDLNVK